MFVRKKPNKSGLVSIQVIDKSSGSYKVLKTIGSSSDPLTINKLFEEGKRWMMSFQRQVDMFELADKQKEEKQVVEYLFSNIESILINGTQIILEKVYKKVGFNKINDDILKHLVVSRLSHPMSKSATTDTWTNSMKGSKNKSKE